MTPTSFLQTLWGQELGGQVLLWTLPDKLSTWFTALGNLDAWVEAHQNKDIYTGVSLAPLSRRMGPRQRVTSGLSAGIAGAWADIDIQDPVHKKPNLPQSIEKALEVIESVQKPSIVVNSGHGLQCWWLFQKPWVFKDEFDRRLAQQVARGWQITLLEAFSAHNYTLDMTHDLARVLRLPGTTNHKGIPKPVEVVEVSDFRWREIKDIGVPKEKASMIRRMQQISPAEVLDLNSDQPLPRRWQVLMENSDKFAATWAKNREDMPDESPSGYDMSLANIAADGGASDQEIAAIIINFRKFWGHDLKLRMDYLQRTIEKARYRDVGRALS